jgi:hypothetical protein
MTLFLLSISIYVLSQDLPKYKGSRYSVEERVEFANISITNHGYTFDDSIRFQTCKEIGRLLCEKEKKVLFREYQYPRMYISLSIDKQTSMILVDSILNEITSFGLLTVYYKIKNELLSGYALRLLPVNEARNEIFKQNHIYVPPYNINDCKKKKINVENNTTKWMKPPPPPPDAPEYLYPLDFIPKLSNDSTIDNQKIFILSKQDNYFSINGQVYRKKSADRKIQDIIKNQRYIIVLEQNKSDIYNDYIELISLCYSNLYKLRDENREQEFRLNVLTYTISDKECLRIVNYNR